VQTHLRAARTILAVAVCLGPFIFGCGHDHSTFYSSLTDADKAGEITRGWLPDFLPKSSHAIRQVYDLSPSTEWCEFELAPADAQSLRKRKKRSRRFRRLLRTCRILTSRGGLSYWKEISTSAESTARVSASMRW